jgi:hypothetical protein
MYDLARTCFCYLINSYDLLQNNLGFEFAHAIHSSDFSEYEEHKPQEKKFEGSPLIRRSSFRTTYQEDEPVDEHVDEPPPEI